jgi:transcriptional regulator with XRE-family HTH domain
MAHTKDRKRRLRIRKGMTTAKGGKLLSVSISPLRKKRSDDDALNTIAVRATQSTLRWTSAALGVMYGAGKSTVATVAKGLNHVSWM